MVYGFGTSSVNASSNGTFCSSAPNVYVTGDEVGAVAPLRAEALYFTPMMKSPLLGSFPPAPKAV
jgi:hypothetical protein